MQQSMLWLCQEQQVENSELVQALDLICMLHCLELVMLTTFSSAASPQLQQAIAVVMMPVFMLVCTLRQTSLMLSEQYWVSRSSMLSQVLPFACTEAAVYHLLPGLAVSSCIDSRIGTVELVVGKTLSIMDEGDLYRHMRFLGLW
jgi:hypothetical protein